MKWCWVILFLVAALPLSAQEICKISELLPDGMERGDLYYLASEGDLRGVLVLCPGCNGNGAGFLQQKAWRKFARENGLGLAALSFASDVALLEAGCGYYYASQGSGNLLLGTLRRAYGRDLPIFLFGFSGGAHFTSRFVEANPERVVAWCADSAGWWDTPRKAAITPPGIVACGEDDPCYGASMIYFRQGRAVGKPWLWISIPHLSHMESASLEEFVRNYFSACARKDPDVGRWVDVDSGTIIPAGDEPACLTGWIPDRNLIASWKRISSL